MGRLALYCMVPYKLPVGVQPVARARQLLIPDFFNRKAMKFQQLIEWARHNMKDMQQWDWRAIIICATVALVFWIFNSLNDNHTTYLEYPLDFQVSEENVVTITPPPAYLTVNVSGNGWNLLKRSLDMDVEPEVISLDNYRSILGNNYISTKSLISSIATKLKDLQVNFLLEDSLYFHFDTISTTQVRLAIDSSALNLAPGYQIVSDIQITPQNLVISGPSDMISTLDDTLLLDLQKINIASPVNEQVPVNFPEHRMLKVNRTRVKVQFSVVKYDNRRINTGLELLNFPRDSTITVDPGKATISYLIEADEQYMPQDSLAVVLDYNQLDRRDSTIVPRLVTPGYFFEVELQPKKFKVRVEKQ